MHLLQLLQENVWLAAVIISVLGLLVGSFLNVVIHRLPLMMQQSWRQESVGYLSEQPDVAEVAKDKLADIQAVIAKDTPLTLSKPASRCPSCDHKIRWYENIPMISWLVLAGKCSSCKQKISIRYPFVEIITAVCSFLVFMRFGISLQLVFALGFAWSLIALTGMDFDTQLLPDRITFPLVGAGLAANAMSLFTTPVQSIWGCVIGFLCLWIVNKAYFTVTLVFRGQGQEGMGYGDFKLLAALGAWMGPIMLPLIILLSTLVGSVVGLVFLVINKGKSLPFAFGPYLAIAGFVAFLYGKPIMAWYLGMYG